MKNYTQINMPANPDANGRGKPSKKPVFAYFVRILLVLLTLVVSGYIVNLFIFRSKATADVATVVFTPRSHDLSEGEIFTQSVRFNSGTKKISGIDITINYNGQFVEYLPQSATQMLAATVPAAYFTNRVIEKVTATNGPSNVRIVMVANKTDSDLLSNLLLSLRFRAKTASPNTTRYLALDEPLSMIAGNTGADNDHRFDIDSAAALSTLQIGATKSCTTDSDCGTNGSCSANSTCSCKAGFYNCDHDWNNGCEATEACPTSGNVSLTLSVKLQGVNKTPSATNKIKVKLNLVGSDNNQQALTDVELTVSNNNDGVFAGTAVFPNVIPGDGFKLFVKGPKHIQKRFCSLTPTGGVSYHCAGNESFSIINGINTANLTAVSLLAGDLPPQDGVLNSLDVTAVKDCIKTPTAECINRTDVNYDGVTNGTDFSLVLASMAIKYDDED